MSSEPTLLPDVTLEDYQWIAEAAYYKALARGFTPGYEQVDWLVGSTKGIGESLFLRKLL